MAIRERDEYQVETAGQRTNSFAHVADDSRDDARFGQEAELRRLSRERQLYVPRCGVHFQQHAITAGRSLQLC